MATASLWRGTSVGNVLRPRLSSSSSPQRSCGLSLKSNGVQLPQFQVHCRLRSGRLRGRATTVVAPRAVTDEEQQTATVNVKEFLEDLKAVGRVSDFQPTTVVLPNMIVICHSYGESAWPCQNFCEHVECAAKSKRAIENVHLMSRISCCQHLNLSRQFVHGFLLSLFWIFFLCIV